ncbi:MAG TPA: hypothetical protein VNA28_13395 [Solirubrobacteraceae bacterium]|nr:hypothetical protein [Solirubrobacteraceae bacterium]
MTWLDELTRRTVIVTTTDQESFRGVAMEGYDDWCVLANARLQQQDGISSLLDGEIWIPRSKVHFVQVPPAEEP